MWKKYSQEVHTIFQGYFYYSFNKLTTISLEYAYNKISTLNKIMSMQCFDNGHELYCLICGLVRSVQFVQMCIFTFIDY